MASGGAGEHAAVGAAAQFPAPLLLPSAAPDAPPAAPHADYTVRVWQANDGTQLKCYEGHKDAVRAITWTEHGDQLASGTLPTAAPAESSGAALGPCPLPAATPAFEPSCMLRLLTGSQDGTVRIWRRHKGIEHVFELGPAVFCLAWAAKVGLSRPLPPPHRPRESPSHFPSPCRRSGHL